MSCSSNDVHKNLKERTRIFFLYLSKMGIFLLVFVLYSSFCFNYYVLFHLNNNIAIECLALVDWLVFVKLQNHTNLGLIFHWKQESFHDVLVLDDETISLSMEPEIFLVKINCIFASRHRQINFV